MVPQSDGSRDQERATVPTRSALCATASTSILVWLLALDHAEKIPPGAGVVKGAKPWDLPASFPALAAFAPLFDATIVSNLAAIVHRRKG